MCSSDLPALAVRSRASSSLSTSSPSPIIMVNMLGEETVPTHDPAANIPGYIALDTQYLLPVAELYAKGILCGYDDLEFDGSCKLTRAEAAALIISLFDTSKRHGGL